MTEESRAMHEHGSPSLAPQYQAERNSALLHLDLQRDHRLLDPFDDEVADVLSVDVLLDGSRIARRLSCDSPHVRQADVALLARSHHRPLLGLPRRTSRGMTLRRVTCPNMTSRNDAPPLEPYSAAE